MQDLITQTCIEIKAPGGPGVLQSTLRSAESCDDNQLLIKVSAAGVNRPDVFQRLGLYPPPPGITDIPGLEVSGVVVDTGKNVRNWEIGDNVCALLSGGGYSNLAVADESLCLPIPKSITVTHAASLPETCFTVWHNLFERAHLQSGEWLLVHGGASGIGTMAIQIACALGVKVIATAGTDEKCDVCIDLGAIRALNYNKCDFVDEINQLTESGVNVVLDMVGGDYVMRNIHACAEHGRIISIAFLRGSNVQIDLMPVMLKKLVLTGSTLRSQSTANKARIAQALLKTVWPLIEQGKIKPVIDQFFRLSDASEAHQRMESNKHIGKILLIP